MTERILTAEDSFAFHRALLNSSKLVVDEITRLRSINTELLEALERTVEGYIGTDYYERDIVEHAQSVIAKAKGKRK